MKKSVKILIIVLCLIIVGLITFIVVDKVVNTKEGGELTNKSNNVIIAESKNNEVALNNTTTTNNKNDTAKNKISSNSNSSKIDSNYAKEYIKIIDKIETDFPENDITCDLIYFNNDNIPDLVIGYSGYWVSLYIYENGVVYNPVDMWVYGAGGNHGYQYQEKEGIILNYNSDFAGGILTKTIDILNSKNEFDILSVTEKGADVEEDDDNYELINKSLEEYGGYFYNDQKISEQEYNNKLKMLPVNIDENNFIALYGNRTTVEIKKQLQQ